MAEPDSDIPAVKSSAHKSYQSHRDWERQMLVEDADGNMALPSAYVAPDTIDAWRHKRMYDLALPVIESDPGASWMTVGDGRFGADAHYLASKGCDVLATSLTDDSLALAQKDGYIEKFRAINAEDIDFPNGAFDYVLCKEAYHHFPRPPIAFYEMLRVARKAVVLIEPQKTRERLLDVAKWIIKKTIRGDRTDLFEDSGNYIFRVSVAQVRDMMLSLNMRTLAYRRFNDFYHPRLSADKLDANPASLLTKTGILVQDVLSRLRLMDYGLACIVVFKGEVGQEVQDALRLGGFAIESLPSNPYLDNEG